jgi:hypothetical protein
MRIGLASIVVWSVAACGDDSLDPGAGNDAGRGTRTLAVEGIVRASSRHVNADDRTDFDTEIIVRVSLGNRSVASGTVVVTSATGKTSLTYRGDRWSGDAPGYDQVYVLDVVDGHDKVEGLRVDGPDIHVFSQPTESEVVNATMPLRIEWSRGDRADAATLHAENTGSLAISDTGSYSLAAGSLKSDKTEPRQNTLRLTRTNRVVPNGAVAGSVWAVSIDNAIVVVAQPQGMPL